MHMEDLKDGRAFVEVAQRVSKKKPIVVLKAGRDRRPARRPPAPTPAALAGDDKVYDDILRAGRRGPGARACSELLAVRPRAADPARRRQGENVVIITGAGGSGVLLSDACVQHRAAS